MSAEIVQFVPRPNPNRDALDRIHGVQANVERPGAIVNEPVNGCYPPHVDTAPSEMNTQEPT